MTDSPQTPVPRSRFFGLVFGILRRPRATLERIAEMPRRPWRRVALIIIVAVILPAVATYSVSSAQPMPTIEDPRMMQKQGAVSAVPVGPRGVVVSSGPGMVAGAAMPMPGPSPIVGLILPALGRLGGLVASWLIWSGVLYVGSTMMGGRNTFGHMLHMIIWTWAPFAVRGVLQAAYIWLTSSLIAHQGLSGLVAAEAPLAGIPTPPSTGTVIARSVLGQVDIYLFWHLALVAVGLIAVAHLPRRKAVMLTLGAWVLLVLLGLLPNVIIGSFAGAGRIG